MDQLPNLTFPTLGGKQLWADVKVAHPWRIQESVVTGHHRLLGLNDVRYAAGSYDHCEAALRRLAPDWKPKSDHLVLLLHGIFRSKDSFGPMVRALRRAGYEAVAVNYPSTRRDLAAHAAQLAAILDRAEGIRRVSFVTHSMGGIVTRMLLGRTGDAWRERIAVHRVVTIGTPHRGAEVAALLLDQIPAFAAVAGPSLRQLRPETVGEVPPLAVPFGAVVGVRGDGRGWNPLITGEDDMTVSAASALPDGAEDTLAVPGGLHTFLMVHPAVIAATLRYLETGRFAG